MSDNNKPKQPQKPTEENKKFKERLERLKDFKFSNLQEFIKTLDALQ